MTRSCLHCTRFLLVDTRRSRAEGAAVGAVGIVVGVVVVVSSILSHNLQDHFK